MFREILSRIFRRSTLQVTDPERLDVSTHSYKRAQMRHLEDTLNNGRYMANYEQQNTDPADVASLTPQPSQAPQRAPTTSMFAFLSPVLDTMYPQLEAIEQGDPLHAINRQLKAMAEDYARLNSSTGRRPAYGSPLAKWCYLYKYAPIRAYILSSIVCRHSQILEMLDDDVSMVCIGGGPGTDVLGIAMAMELKHKQASVHATIVDAVGDWAQCWEQIVPRIGGSNLIEAEYVQHEITSGLKSGLADQLPGSRLYTMSYCLAEMCARKGQAEQFFADIFGAMTPGSLFLFVDNANATFYQWFDTICADANMRQVAGLDRIPKISELPDREEALSCFHGKLKGNAPHLNAEHCFRIVSKP